MQSEHLSNVHPGWVLGGWLVAIAVTSAAFLAMVGIGLVASEASSGTAFAISVAIGFFVGGLFVGVRWSEAPILHAVALTMVSVVALLFAVLVRPEAGAVPTESVEIVLAVLLVQLAAAIWGGVMARRLVGRTTST